MADNLKTSHPMNISFRRHFKSEHVLGKLLATGCCVWLSSLIVAPMVFAGTGQALPQVQSLQPAVASSAAVPIAQQPLTIRKPIPPNIVLMLDNSGSMASDFMPDWDYITDCSDERAGGDDIDQDCLDNLRDSSVNGAYYNPNVVYTPPPKADGTFYPASPKMSAAYENGFLDTDADHQINISQCGPDQYYKYVYVRTWGGKRKEWVSACPNFPYFTQVTADVPSSYQPGKGCADGTYQVPDGHPNAGKCADSRSKKAIDSYKASYHERKHGRCDPPGYVLQKEKEKQWWGGYKYVYYCVEYSYTYSAPFTTPDTPTCPKGGTYNATTDMCDTTKSESTKVFTYTTKNSSGDFVQHFVATSQVGCSTATAAIAGSDCTYSADAQQNVANWFSYYRTRMLLAKSGLMEAFSGLNPKYRFGFGAIHDTETFPSGVTTKSFADHELAEVAPFGTGKSSTDQKSLFWTWVNDETPSGGTPLRTSLQAVGEYYQTSQPWASTDPNDSSKTDYLACRQSYTILTTDGFWNGPTPGVGNADDTNGPKISGPNGATGQYTPAPPFSGPYHKSGVRDGNGSPTTSNTLADVAMYYWDHDLQNGSGDEQDISNEVPTNAADPAFWQHMVTFTMGMGFTPQDIKPAGTSIDSIFQWATAGKKDAITDFSWPEPSAPDSRRDQGRGGTIDNVTDLAHAAVNGHGGFYSATSPLTFTSGLDKALQRAQERTGSGASLAANSTQLKSGTTIYQALYHTAVWTGALEAYSIDQNTGDVAQSPTWNAATEIPAPSKRNIYTYNPATQTYLAFKNDGSSPPALSTAELDALGKTTADQVQMIDYLRGSHAKEIDNGGKYRTRTTVLGDIVDSQPVYVGAPNATTFEDEKFTGSDKYNTFVTDNKDRTGLVYVAANDGMLHAFNAETGKEVYAFLPGYVITHGGTNAAGNVIGISELASPKYGTLAEPHQYFNDGKLNVAAAYFAEGSATTPSWHTVLVGTTGRGLAETIYALDITDPSDIKFLWSHSAHDGGANSGYIGQMTGKPVIAQVANGTWAVLISNGYNSANGTAALLQINLATGDLTVHTTDSDTGNGLAGPGVWIGDPTNGISTVAYAGDLKGHVWAFPLTKTGSDGKTIEADNDSSGTLLFTATYNGNPQPITAGMLVRKDQSTKYRWLFFGTGRYLAAQDLNDQKVQSWYGLIVHTPQKSDLVSNLESENRKALKPRYIIAQFPGETKTVTKDGKQVQVTTMPTRVISQAGSSKIDSIAASGASGWYIDLQTPTTNDKGEVTGYANNGERMTEPNEFDGNLLIATSQVPKSNDICNPSGTGWPMDLDPFTGTGPKNSFFDVNGDGLINSADKVTVNGKKVAASGVGFKSLPHAAIFINAGKLGNTSSTGNAYISLSNGKIGHLHTGGQGKNGKFQRVSWREITGD